MHTARFVLGGSLACLVALAAPTLRAAEGPGAVSMERALLVSVEVEPGAGTDAAQVRRAIGDELGRPVVAPGDPRAAMWSGAGGPDVLLVAVSRERIVLSMRQRSDEAVARAMVAPTDRASRLRAIAWLAGNLARDQATPFLVTDIPASGAAAEQAPAPATAPEAATEPPPAVPPPARSARVAPPAVASTLAAQPRFESPAAPFWSIAVSGGLAATNDFSVLASTAGPKVFQVDVLQHRTDHWMWGAGLDVGPGPERGSGAAVLGGIEKRWRRVTLDATMGFGIESVLRSTLVSTTSTSSTVNRIESTTSSSHELGIYGRAGVTIGVGLTPVWELFTRVGTRQLGGGGLYMATVGVRRNLP